MEIEEYRDNLFEQIKLDTAVNGTSDKEEFINYLSTILYEAEEIDDEIIYLPFEGTGRRNKKIQIDGYSYSELDEYLTLYISTNLEYSKDIITLTETEASKIFSRACAFIEDADFIVKNAEESAPAYGLAVDIQNNYSLSVRKFCVYLLTDKAMSKKIKIMKGENINGKPVEFHIWDINRMFQLETSKSVKEDITIDLLKYTDQGLACLPSSKTEDYTAYLCNIPGRLIADLYNTYGGRLLEGNVRSFLQTKGKVNKGIRVTILNHPEMFFAYNNGITTTASSIKTITKNGVLYITEMTALQIVNGGQTTASLAMALLNDKKDGSEKAIEKIFVPMKLSVVSPEKAQKLIPDIARFANSQNKVSDADLLSNHPFHIRMEGISRRIFAPAVDGNQYGTHWYYERANGQYKQETYKSTESEKKNFALSNPKCQMFNKTELSKFINVRRCLPHIASAGGQKSFAKFAAFIADAWEKHSDNFGDDFFRNVVSMAILFRQSDKIVKVQPWYNSYKANIVVYTLSLLIYKVHANCPDKTIDYSIIWQRQKLSNAWQCQIEHTSKVVYEYLISDTRPVENVTEWAKREACWTGAKNLNITLLPEFVNELISKLRDTEKEKNAREEQKLTGKVQKMIDVVNYGSAKWKELGAWALTHRLFTQKELSFIKTAIDIEKGKTPSEAQCREILKVLEKAREEGYPG